MEQSPCWGGNIRSECLEIPRLLCNPKVHYRVPKGPPKDSIYNQMNTGHILRPYFSKTGYSKQI
jgi:hypothetical protein